MQQVLGGRKGGHLGACQQEVKLGGADQEASIGQMAAGVNVISSTAQQFPQVGEHIKIEIETENAATRRYRLSRTQTTGVKGADRFLLRFVDREHRREARQLEEFAKTFGHVAKLQISTCPTGACQTAHDSTETAAVNEANLTQVQHYGPPIPQQPANMGAQSIALGTCNDASIAAHNRDASDLASIERERHPSYPLVQIDFWQPNCTPVPVIQRNDAYPTIVYRTGSALELVPLGIGST